MGSVSLKGNRFIRLSFEVEANGFGFPEGKPVLQGTHLRNRALLKLCILRWVSLAERNEASFAAEGSKVDPAERSEASVRLRRTVPAYRTPPLRGKFCFRTPIRVLI